MITCSPSGATSLLHMHLYTCHMRYTALGWNVECATCQPLPCSATYTAGDGSARTEQQTVLFSALNPLSVRTKVMCFGQLCGRCKVYGWVCSITCVNRHRAAEHCLQTRTVAQQVFVEVCVENQSATAPLFLEYVRLEPSANAGPVQQLSPATAAPASKPSASLDAAAFLQQHIDALTIVQPNGAHNLLYQMPSPPPQAFSGSADGKADIGRLEIKWRRSMGEVLSTAHTALCSSN